MPRKQTIDELKRLAKIRTNELSNKAKENKLNIISKVGLDRMRLMWQTTQRHK